MPTMPRLTALVLPGLLAATGLAAQEARPPDPPPEMSRSAATPPAPVGHRQPRAADLPPPSAEHDELTKKIEQMNRALDRKLQICRNC